MTHEQHSAKRDKNLKVISIVFKITTFLIVFLLGALLYEIDQSSQYEKALETITKEYYELLQKRKCL